MERPAPAHHDTRAGGARSWWPPSGLTGHLGLFLAAAAVALPVLIHGVIATKGYYPAVDDGTIAARSFDVWTADPPLLGQFSLSSARGAPATHSPGPLLYWLVSVPARLGPDWSFPLYMGLINVALLVMVITLARRRGGNALMWVVAGGLVLLIRALGPTNLYGIWNPWAALVPFVALIFVAWSVADGDRGLLAVAVLLASFVMQAHLTYVLSPVMMLVVAVTAGWALWRSGRSDHDLPGPRWLRRPPAWFPWASSAAVGVLAWALPVYQQVTVRPGNMTLIFDAGSAGTARLGSGAGWSSLWRVVRLPPLWARPVADNEAYTGLGGPGLAAKVLVVGALVGFAALTALAVVRRDRLVTTGAAITWTLIAGVWFVAASLPEDSLIVVAYSFRWFAIASAMLWLVAGLGLVRLVLDPWWRGGTRRAVAAPAPPLRAFAAGTVVVAMVAFSMLTWNLQRQVEVDRPARELGRLVVHATEPGHSYLVGRSGRFNLAFTPAVLWALRSHDRNVVLADGGGRRQGPRYERSGRACAGIVILTVPDAPSVESGRTLGTIDVSRVGDTPPVMRVDLVDDQQVGGSC